MLKHKHADRRRQITLCASSINFTEQFCHPHAVQTSDVFKLSPERGFKSDARLVAIKPDRMFSVG
jgi:hypothetical protein